MILTEEMINQLPIINEEDICTEEEMMNEAERIVDEIMEELDKEGEWL